MKAIIIGSGFASLSAACYLARDGYDVEVFEKNATLGGRAQKWISNGYQFDMGPSWYWMPEVFEEFYNDFGKTTSDFYELERLSPSYQVVWNTGMDSIPSDYDQLLEYFERYEPGSSAKLESFLKQAELKYEVGMKQFVEKPSLSVAEYLDPQLLISGAKLDLLVSIRKHIKKYFKNPRLIQLLEFPILFLGAEPAKTPALYSMMNYADMKLGTWYPQGGMFKVVEAMVQIATAQGVQFHTKSGVDRILVEENKATGIEVGGIEHYADLVISGADYHHTEKLLPDPLRNYSDSYWQSRTMAPSCLLYYIGLDTTIPGLEHHNLFFEQDFDQHAKDIYTDHTWPKEPLFYVSCTSKTDPRVAPQGGENLFALIPVSTELEDTPEIRQKYFDMICQRIEDSFGVNIKEHLVVYRDYAGMDFKKDYNAFKGNAYGLANTLKQTAFLKPKCRNKHLDNLFYAGQLTVPGPGVPPAIVSGRIVSNLIIKEYSHETTIRPSFL